MKTINIHEAKTHLSRLLEEAVNGEPFIIAKAGKPMVVVTSLTSPTKAPLQRLGFMVGQFQVPDDLDEAGDEEIADLFEGGQ